ncbi:hypothetical protein PYW07_013640 [Mythimna separata]|uniref:Uncharacterized protein n=1 Tax=Mythimna separata TaxID=271217 RepID=A0AAD8DPL6_MYTSE|nr:hypothetical protein PYW07_013640 [Mythimna separata]
MSQILQKLRDVDPSDSDAVKEAITAFIQSLLKHTAENCNIWLRTLEDVITRFPRYCSQHRPTIENFLAHFLDSSNYYNVITAAKCAHSLQQIRPSQDKTASPKNCWREQMAILCDAAHSLIEVIFSKTVNIYKANQSAKKKDVELLANSPLTKALSNIVNVKKSHGSGSGDKQLVLRNRLRNIFVFIQAMLVEVFPVAKPVQPQLILEVVVQALSVSSSTNTDAAEAASVKTQALRTLDAMILCLGPNLIPFSGLVFRSVMQTLKWSSENPSEESRKVRVTAYNSLTKWLGLLHVHRLSNEGRGRSWEDELTKHIVEDITPVRKIVQLTASNQYTKNLSKKAKRKLANQTLQQSAIASHMPGEKNKTNASEESNNDVANAALECAETFLTVCGIYLKPATHKTFQERLVRECYNVDAYGSARSVCLLRALDAARKNTPTTVAPPTQYCVQLYSTLVNSRCDEIRKFCSHALLDIRLHLHCSPPSIGFVLDARPDATADKNKTKELSEENIQKLSSQDSSPEERPRSSNEEVHSPYPVEEEDEGPATKIPRLAEDEDQISISSDSQESIVIPDGSDDEVQEVNEENQDVDVDEVEVLQEPEIGTEESSQKTSEDSKEEPTDNIVIEDSVDHIDSYRNTRKRKLSESNDQPSIYDAETQAPVNTSADTIECDKSPVSLEIAYDSSNSQGKVVILENLDDENLPSTNETDDVQITCGQALLVSSQEEPAKDQVEVEIEISAVPTKEGEETKENGHIIAPNENNIEVKITSKEISVEDMLADFVDEVNEEPSLIV